MRKLTMALLVCASVANAREAPDPSRRPAPRSPVNSLYRFDVATGETKKLLAPEDVLRGAEEKLSAAERQQRERTRQSGRGFVHFQLSHDGKIILASLSGRLFIVRLSDNDVSELK